MESVPLVRPALAKEQVCFCRPEPPHDPRDLFQAQASGKKDVEKPPEEMAQ
jgi:hypothetical protein